MFSCKYAPGSLKVDTSLPSQEYINNLVNSDLSDTVSNAINSPHFKYFLSLLLPAHVVTLNIRSLFLKTKFTDSDTFLLDANILGSIGSTTGFYGTEPLSN